VIYKTTIMVAPFGKGRPRFSKGGFAYTPAKTVAKEAELRHWLVHDDAPKFEGPLKVCIHCYFKRPKSAPKKRVYPCVKPDIDNLAKTVLDAGNKILFDDDVQVVHCTVSKQYGEPERIELTVMPMEMETVA
jgi:Holliday junction resolvase RusA-like endonuclease